MGGDTSQPTKIEQNPNIIPVIYYEKSEYIKTDEIQSDSIEIEVDLDLTDYSNSIDN